jgi:hypothetical protein
MRALLLALMLPLSTIALAEEGHQSPHPGQEPFLMVPGPAQMSQRCMPSATVKSLVLDKQGKWTALSQEQYNFVEGLFVMNPNTAPGLPLGNAAVLAQLPNDKGGVIIFIDADKACDAMPVPEELMPMLSDVAAHVAHHDGEGT